MTVFRILITAFSFLFIGLTGCSTTYKYVPPTLQAGLQCVTQCLSMKNTCRDRELENARAAKQVCEKKSAEEYFECKTSADEEFFQCQVEAREDFYACLKYASDRSSCYEEECEEKDCYERRCREYANFRFCDNDYRECYQQCGGVVEVMK